jgi:pSer/pThr/pTyr-binding forkhead associated (FHA) protein
VLLADAHISSMHLVVEGTESDGRRGAWLHDKSTNGAFLNGKRIGKGNKELARSGDLVSFVVTPNAQVDGSYSYVNDPNLVRASRDSVRPAVRADWPARHPAA